MLLLRPLLPPGGGVIQQKNIFYLIFEISSYYCSILFNGSCFQEGLDFGVFKRPFNSWTWAVVICLSILVSIFISFIWKVLDHKANIVENIAKILSMSLQANLGVNRFDSFSNYFGTLQVVIFITLLTGNVVWLTYNGSLLSGLIAPIKIKPFHDLETLSTSQYRLTRFLQSMISAKCTVMFFFLYFLTVFCQ